MSANAGSKSAAFEQAYNQIRQDIISGVLEEHERLTEIQQDVLEHHSTLIKDDGKMVYATCSVFPSENREQVDKFLARHEDFQLEEEVTNKVGQDGFDGFYMARLSKKK